VRNNHFDSSCNSVKVEVVLKDVGVKENGAKARATWKYSPAHPRAKLWNVHLWIKRSCWGNGIEFKLANKAWAHQKNSSYRFSQLPARKCLNRSHVSLCHITPPQGGKVKHHWGSRRNKFQAATLYGYCINLSNGKRNATCTSHSRAMGMWLFKQGWQRPKWKDSKTSNVETQVQTNASGMKVRGGIGAKMITKVWIGWTRCLTWMLMMS